MKILDFEVGLNEPLFLIAGPCVIEDLHTMHETARHLVELTDQLGINFVFKSSFDKANRTSMSSYRGPGIEAGLRILEDIKNSYGCHILTDVHDDTPLDEVSDVVDILQTPAFLCRQTNFIQEVAEQGKPVNIKKGQFLSPQEMNHVVEKAIATGNQEIMVCERGTTFGYNNLVSDMRSLIIMRDTGCPVVYDATHSVQMPGGNGGSSGGSREFASHLASAAAAVGISGLFIETHPNPEVALSDGPNMIFLEDMEEVLTEIIDIDRIVKKL